MKRAAQSRTDFTHMKAARVTKVYEISCRFRPPFPLCRLFRRNTVQFNPPGSHLRSRYA
jgi:hypothetical protein